MPAKGKKDTFEPLRWTLEQAASEFPINPRTLAKRCKALSLEPGEDGRWSTTQICAAVFGDYESHRARKMAADADMAEDERDRQRRRLMEAEQVMRAWESIISPAKQRLQTIPSKLQSRLGLNVEQAKIAGQEIDEVLSELSKEPDYEPNENFHDTQLHDTANHIM